MVSNVRPLDAEWVFFDLGDTLVDNTKVWIDMLDQMRLALNGIGREYSLEQLTTLFEATSALQNGNPFGQTQVELGLNGAERQIVERSVRWRHDLEEPLPGVSSLLDSVGKHYRMGIIANQAAGSSERCEQFGIRDYFDVFVASSELGAKKPDVRIFNYALQQAKCTADRAVMVGDRIDNDIRPAKMLGMKTIRITQGFQRLQQPRDEVETPDYTASCFGDVQTYLLGDENTLHR